MFPDISKIISLLKENPEIINNIKRGIERETLRITTKGSISKNIHPKELGQPLTHKWITTDFAESLLEFITPANNNIKYNLAFLKDLHRYTALNLKNERMWPLSIPCFIKNNDSIKIAQYGSSNLGRFKTIYREGLKNRYGALMQLISGIHYNFSLPVEFWKIKQFSNNIIYKKEEISENYLHLIRNYYRFGWIISYLFGASPMIWKSFIKNKNIKKYFYKEKDFFYYFPYATSLRISDFGYTNNFQKKLNIKFNNLDNYISSVKKALCNLSPNFKKLGIKKNDKYIQLNANILQIENELYTQIRPKQTIKHNELQLQALLKRGIEYIEVRTLDINPFSSIGINETQASFIELFLVWCALADEPKIENKELNYYNQNWNRIILEGKKPKQIININNKQKPLITVCKQLINNLIDIAKIFDISYNTDIYQSTCFKIIEMIKDPRLTYSSLILNEILEKGINKFGLELSEKYFKQLTKEPYEVITKKQFEIAKIKSIKKQLKIEKNENKTFEEYLNIYSSRLNS
ncbi:glutamate--cysteine ligase [Candidatus Providencia siddallii]|uniref:Glutamate--cysteine ligase n=1 Tax=Candidatus Providencia siddallii TaxID=1715285 RepID=A0ABM9NPS6_9GAMM